MNNPGKEIGENLVEQINNQILKELNTNGAIQEKLDEMFAKVEEEFIQAFSNLIINGNANFSELTERFQQLQAQSIEKKHTLYNNMQGALQQVITKAFNKAKYSEFTSWFGSYIAKTNNIDVGQNLGGYMRKLVLQQFLYNAGYTDLAQQFTSNETIGHYKDALKGYLREEVLAAAITKVLSQYGIVARQSGSARNGSNKHQMIFDVVLGTSNIKSMNTNIFEDLLQRYAAVEGAHWGTGTAELYSGVQSKSWVTPFEKMIDGAFQNKQTPLNKTFLTFGTHTEFLPPEHSEARHYWHAGVSSAMQNIMSIIGYQNMIFSTGDSIYWTGELLTQFRQQGYVLCFRYNTSTERLSDTGTVYMSPHQD